MISKQRVIEILVAVALLIATLTGGYFWGREGAQSVGSDSRQSKEYPLLAKRIFLDNPSDTIINFSLLRAQLQEYFSENDIVGGLYFEYLPTGTSIRIEGETLFTGASLIKLPAALDLYKASELGRVDIDKTITLKQEWLDAKYGHLYEKGAGYQLTLRDAARIMLEDSDNTALRAIGDSVNGLLEPNEQAFNSLDVELRQDQNLMVSVSPRAYASFLKCLYFACHLNHDNSQELLTYLSESKFDTRIVAGVADKGVTIAHKTGNFEEDTQSDCGIVYLTSRNYIICIMIKGQDNESTDKQIADISRITHSFVTAIESSR